MLTPIAALKKICHVEKDMVAFGEGAMHLTFKAADASTKIRIIIRDEVSGADIAITHMRTLPATARGKGLGKAALQQLISWAKAQHLDDIRALGVRHSRNNFWESNGFLKLGNPANDFVYRPVSVGSNTTSKKPPA